MRSMKKVLKTTSILTMLIVMMTVSAGCGKKTESWAYTHEPTEEAIALYDNGKAVFKGEKYTYTKDDEYITLTDKDKNETKLRYEMNGDTMTLYEKSTYKLSSEEEHDGLVGTWTQDNGWSYVFTKDGEFSEEGIFFGHYTVDEKDSCIKLMYSDPIEDAYLYYTLNDDELIIDYPWPMTKTQQN
ncbi:hypothetical protein SAMN02910263_00964 [Butyrivibrio sp. INlla16]|nr:hypothetical protein SAMN02910263_00964 [Butyrivibrio sp. INlla16]SEL59777.1 hypothetical protein SAMN04487770_11341 [Butyrivibrio sp. ob235]